MIRLPVLVYHHVGPPRVAAYSELTVSPQKFNDHVRWLHLRGYVPIRASDWLAHCRDQKPLPKKPVLLTFDDAYADIAEFALPVLHVYGFHALVFVVSGCTGKTNEWDLARFPGPHRIMTLEQIREWAAKGIEFGAHSRTHPDLTKLDDDSLAAEVSGSARDLAAILTEPVISFAYPYGYYAQRVREEVKRSFNLAFTDEEGLNDAKTNPLLLRRMMVRPGDSIFGLECRLRLGRNPILDLRWRLRLRSRLNAALRFLRATQEPY